jgi:hypothetical protein
MRALRIALIEGTVLVLLGRWVYRNPRKVYPSSMYRNPDSPIAQIPIKTFGVMAIFVGSAVALLAIGQTVLGPDKNLVFAMIGSAAATWLLRPRTKRHLVAISGDSLQTTSGADTDILTKKGKQTLAVAVGVAVAAAIITLVFFWVHR